MRRAYADDLAMILRKGITEFRALEKIFLECAMISGLHLNIPKTNVVPLFMTDLTVLAQEIGSHAPSWNGIGLDYKAKYLGFYLGPEAADSSWTKPLEKFRERVAVWSSHGLGPHYTLAAYFLYVLPVLLFVAQLEELPECWKHAEKWAITELFPGPGAWISATAAHNLKVLGFPREMSDLRWLSTAAKARVAMWENGCNLQATKRRDDLRRAEGTTEHTPRLHQWRHWFAHNSLEHLAAAGENAAQEVLVRKHC